MKKNILALVIVLVIFLAGYITGVKVNFLPWVKSDDTFQAGWEAAKKRLADYGFAPAMANLEIKNIVGTAVSASGDSITMKIRPLEPFADPALDQRTVTVDKNTKIYALAERDAKVYEQEMADFNKKIKDQAKIIPTPGQATTTAPLIAPRRYERKEAAMSDIKAGVILNVTADSDIKNAKAFKAAEILIQPSNTAFTAEVNIQPATPAPAPITPPAASSVPPASVPVPAPTNNK